MPRCRCRIAPASTRRCTRYRPASRCCPTCRRRDRQLLGATTRAGQRRARSPTSRSCVVNSSRSPPPASCGRTTISATGSRRSTYRFAVRAASTKVRSTSTPPASGFPPPGDEDRIANGSIVDAADRACPIASDSLTQEATRQSRPNRRAARRPVSRPAGAPRSPQRLHDARRRGALRPDHRQEGQRSHPGTLRRSPRTPEEMARLSPDEILGYIRRSVSPRPRRGTCRRWPTRSSMPAARSFPTGTSSKVSPGVGHKTAGVVMAGAFGVPAFPVDTHIHRLAHRWGLSERQERRADRTRPEGGVPRRHVGRRHLQIIYFGREYCPAKQHDLTGCPICSWAATKKRIAAEARRRPQA